jgi:hypothetical protein
LTEFNPKKHDIGGICQSIDRYGFRNPPIWDKTLNNGRGGIAAGNGRTEALAAMEKQNLPVPRGIAVDDQGRWCMPIVFGCNAVNQSEAISFLVDDNNLNLGGDFSLWDMSKIWDSSGYIQMLTAIAEEGVSPVTVDVDALASLILMNENGGPPPDEKPERDEEDSFGKGGPKMMRCPNCDHEWELGGDR